MKLKIFTSVFLISILFVKNARAEFTITPITYNSEEAIDIVFIGDGFTASEQSIYEARVNSSVEYLFDNEPFRSRESNFNIYSIATISHESGISVKGSTEIDTALKTHLNANNLPRLTGIPEEQRSILTNELKKVFKKTIYPIIIMNTTTYGGSGSLNDERRFMSLTQVTLDGQYNAYREILIHEFGHSFGELADEYGGNCSYSEVDDWSFEKYNKKNVTYSHVNDRKWDSLVSNPQYFLGANYCDNQWYRSSNNGIMRSLVRNSGHNELGRILISNRIDEEIEYNEEVVSYQNDGVITLPHSQDKNIRIHADESILESNLYCKDLYVAEFSNLLVRPGVQINCNTMVVLGTITYEQQDENDSDNNIPHAKAKPGSIRYGCKDPNAINFNRFSRHKQLFCVYDNSKARPPHFLSEDLGLSIHNHDH